MKTCRRRRCRTEGGGRKINEYVPPFTPSSSLRVLLSEEASDFFIVLKREKWIEGQGKDDVI